MLLVGPTTSPRVADSRRIDLSDPAVPDSRQPYHAGFGTARNDGPELSRLVASVKRFGSQSVRKLFRDYASGGFELAGVGVIVGSLIDPDGIANEHIRIHAREGQLFRGIVAQAARANALPCSIWREREIYGAAAEALRQPERQVRDAVTSMRAAIPGSWRAEQKVAAAAAWLVLMARRPASGAGARAAMP